MNLESIAKEIAKALKSPDFYMGMGDGAVGVFRDLGYLAYGYIDTDSRYVRSLEKERMIRALRRGVASREKLKAAIVATLSLFDKHVPEEKKDKIYHKSSGSLVGKSLTGTAIMAVAHKISNAGRFGIFLSYYTLLLGGMAERSVYRSLYLKRENPELYQDLKRDDLDLLYFLFEPFVKPFSDALIVRRTHGDKAFNELIDMVGEEVGKYD